MPAHTGILPGVGTTIYATGATAGPCLQYVRFLHLEPLKKQAHPLPGPAYCITEKSRRAAVPRGWAAFVVRPSCVIFTYTSVYVFFATTIRCSSPSPRGEKGKYMVMGVLSSALDLAKAAVAHDEQGALPEKVLPYYKKVRLVVLYGC